jgi:predicted nucleic acid-binding protein
VEPPPAALGSPAGRSRPFARFDLALVGFEDILAAIDLHRLHGFSPWDALAVWAATRSGCSVLYSEHLQAGQRIEGLEIGNSFL